MNKNEKLEIDRAQKKAEEQMTLRDTILSFSDVKEQTVVMPEWGGVKLKLRGVTAKERYELVERSMANGELSDDLLYFNAIIACTCDPDTGERVFGWNDVDALRAKSGVPVERLASIAFRLCGIGAPSDEAAEKNS